MRDNKQEEEVEQEKAILKGLPEHDQFVFETAVLHEWL